MIRSLCVKIFFLLGVVGKRVRKYLSSCYMKNSFREIFIKSFATIEGHEIPLPLCFSQGSTLYIRGKFAIPLKIVSFVWNFSFIRLFPVVFIKYQNLFFFFFHPLALWSIQLQALVGLDFIASYIVKLPKTDNQYYYLHAKKCI